MKSGFKMSETDIKKSEENPKLACDRLNVLLLTYMYMLQCIPRGITDGIAITLQNRKVSYADQVSSNSFYFAENSPFIFGESAVFCRPVSA